MFRYNRSVKGGLFLGKYKINEQIDYISTITFKTATLNLF